MSQINEQKSSMLLNRNKSKEQLDGNFMKIFEEVEKETTNNALATQFPGWDLKPPATFVRRKITKLL